MPNARRAWRHFALRPLLLAALAASCVLPSAACVESEFTLATDSRLRRFFSVPPGMTREDVYVRLTFYTYTKARLSLMSRSGKALETVWVESRRHPASAAGLNFPIYVILSAGDVTDVFEQRRREPLMYFSDDPAIQSAVQ